MEPVYLNPEGFTTQYGFPAYRVFIFGQEVTPDVTSIAINWHDGLEPGTCTITLANKNWRYVITHNDMLQIAKYRGVDEAKLRVLEDTMMPDALRIPPEQVLSRSTTYVAFNPISDDDRAHNTQDSNAAVIKQNIVTAKINAGAADVPPDIFGNQIVLGENVTNLPVQAWRYHFQVGRTIFHPYDPVRIFERDPYNADVWYFMFSGFCSDFTTHNDTKGDSTITVVAEQPSKLLRYGRFTSNPGITDVGVVAVRKAIVADVTIRQPFANATAWMTLPDMMFAMLFGINAFGNPNGFANMTSIPDEKDPEMVTETLYSAYGSASVPRRKWGIGHINMTGSRIYVYGPASVSGTALAGLPPALSGPGHAKFISQEVDSSLESYQEYIHHAVQLSDVDTMIAEGVQKPASFTPTNVWDTMTMIGQRPDIYPVDGGRLIMLLPHTVAGQNNNLTSRDFIKTFALNTEWTSRSDIISSALERIEFVWYVSPKGDYIVEFPLYDFDHTQFGTYGRPWHIDLDHTISTDTTLVDNKVYTQAVCTPQALPNMSAGAGVSPKLGRQQAAILWYLIPTYGVRQAPVQPRGYLPNEAAALRYAWYSINRMNADALTQSAHIIPNLQMWINRPVLMDIVDHYGTTRSVNQNITWGQEGDMSTELGLAYMRGWDGTLDEASEYPRKKYYTIGGLMGRPLNYEILFNPNSPQAIPQAKNTGDKGGK